MPVCTMLVKVHGSKPGPETMGVESRVELHKDTGPERCVYLGPTTWTDSGKESYGAARLGQSLIRVHSQ